MSVDQLAILLGLSALLNVVLLGTLALASLLSRRLPTDWPAPHLPRTARTTPDERSIPVGPGTDLRAPVQPDPSADMPRAVRQQAVRVLSYGFIAAALLIVSLSGVEGRPILFSVLAVGLLATVMIQDVLPPQAFGRWRVAAEAVVALAILTTLVGLSGGQASPYYIGFVLVVGAGALWSAGAGALLLALGASSAYLLAVFIAQPAVELTGAAFERVAFNLLLLALVAYVAALSGREQRRARQADLEHSRYDSLTGIYTRGYFLSRLEGEVQRSARSRRAFSLLMIDLDGLKAANDRFGHAAGDVLLRAVADVVRAGLRSTDVAGRYGGDEMLVLLPETEQAGAVRVAEKVRLDIARLALPRDGEALATTVSIGVVTCPFDGRSANELLRRADLAMYEAKRRGRNQIVHYEHASPPAPSEAAAATSHPDTAEHDRFAPVDESPQLPMAQPSDHPFARSELPPPWGSMRR